MNMRELLESTWKILLAGTAGENYWGELMARTTGMTTAAFLASTLHTKFLFALAITG